MTPRPLKSRTNSLDYPKVLEVFADTLCKSSLATQAVAPLC